MCCCLRACLPLLGRVCQGGDYDQDQASRLLEQDNDAEIARLQAKVARIKQVTLDIRDEVGAQNNFLGRAVRA